MSAPVGCATACLLLALAGCSIDTHVIAPGMDGAPPENDGGRLDDGHVGMRDRTAPPVDAPLPDAPGIDSGVPVPDGGPDCALFTSRHFDPCAIPAPGAEVRAGGMYDTSTGMLTTSTGEVLEPPHVVIDQGGADARLVSVSGFTVPSGETLRVVGPMPLIVASWGDIEIEGDLDVASTRDGARGAGTGASDCDPARRGDPGSGGPGGGGGGGFGGRGGRGGDGDFNGPVVIPGGAGGAATAAPSIVRGGCAGAHSGESTAAVTGHGMGGAGGGAVQLTARGRVRVQGRVLASGAGGGGGPMSSAAGGGGGGSGGYIGLEAPSMIVSGALAANGGGGGEGTSFSLTGDDGDDGRADEMRAAGGSGGSGGVGGVGGMGGALGNADGEDSTGIPNGGGGGGGGGCGYVLVWSSAFTMSGAVISPAPTVSP